MRKLAVLAVLAAMIVAYAIPASALESVFKGFFRTRAFMQKNFDGNDDKQVVGYGVDTAGNAIYRKSSNTDISEFDTRTRLFYNALINDNLKLVTAFEIDAVWGSAAAMTNPANNTAGTGIGQAPGSSTTGTNANGSLGNDGVGVEVKWTYSDINYPLGGGNNLYAKVGLQPAVIGRGFLFNDDMAGAFIGFQNDMMNIPFVWIKPYEGGLGFNKMDVDYYGLVPSFKVANNKVTINPYFVYAYSSNAAQSGLLMYNGMSNASLGNIGQAAAQVSQGTSVTIGSPAITFPAGTSPYVGVPSGGNNTINNIIDPTYAGYLAANYALPTAVGGVGFAPAALGISKLNMYYLGLDVNASFDPISAWFTAIYQGGKGNIAALKSTLGTQWVDTSDSMTFKAWLLALGASAKVNMFDIRFQTFYASGNDPENNGDTYKGFFVPSPNMSTGQSYYWAEIMGRGTFDDTYTSRVNAVSANSCSDHISNIWAANLGTTVKPIADLAINFDIWYARLAKGRYIYTAEDPTAATGAIGLKLDNGAPYTGTVPTQTESYLGTELDLKVTYQLVQNLNLDLIGAYLFAGNATYRGPNSSNPYELGTQLSLNF